MTYRHTAYLHGDYLDGELSPSQKEQVEKHLAECEQCRQDLERLKRLTESLGQIEVELPGHDYFDRQASYLMSQSDFVHGLERIESESGTSAHPGRKILTTLIRLAAAVTLLFSAFYISDISRQKGTTRWADQIQKSEFRALEGPTIDEKLLTLPIGINMLPGPPLPADRKDSAELPTTNSQ